MAGKTAPGGRLRPHGEASAADTKGCSFKADSTFFPELTAVRAVPEPEGLFEPSRRLRNEKYPAYDDNGLWSRHRSRTFIRASPATGCVGRPDGLPAGRPQLSGKRLVRRCRRHGRPA